MFDGCPVLLVLPVQITQGGQVARGFWSLVVEICKDNALFLSAGLLQTLFFKGWHSSVLYFFSFLFFSRLVVQLT